MAQQKNTAKQATKPKASRNTFANAASSATPVNPTSFRIPLWAATLLFAAATLLFFRSQLFGNMYFWQDFAEYVYPAQAFAARYLHNGEIPFWNPYSFAGMPFLADVAVGFFYPPNMLLSLFLTDGKLSVLALEGVIIAHFVLAQVSMFLLMRSFKVSDAGSLISSLSYGFSGIMVHHVFHPMMVAHFAWFPLAFLHFRKALLEANTPTRFLHSLVSGIILGIMMLSGHPQTTLYLVLFLFLYTLWILGATIRTLLQTPLNVVLTGTAAALPILIGAGLFAVQLLHSQEFSAYSERNAMTFERAAMGSMQAQQALTAFVPKYFGTLSPAAAQDSSIPQFDLEGSDYYDYWESAFYAGIPAIMLAMFGFGATFRSVERERLSAFLLFVTVFAFLFALGKNGVLFSIFFKIPLFDRFRIPARMIALATLAITMMAGIGFDELFKRGTNAMRMFILGFGTALLLTIIAAAGAKANVGAGSAVVIALAVALFGFLALRNVLNVQILCALLALLTIIDLHASGADFNASPESPLDDYVRADTRLAAYRSDFSKPDSLYRISVRERRVILSPRNFGLYAPVSMLEGYAPILVERILPPANTPDVVNDLINLRYAVGVDTVRGSAYLAERTTAFPRARMVFGAVQASSDAAAIKTLAQSGRVDFTHQAIVEVPLPTSLSGDSATRVPHTIHCTSYTANSMTYTVDVPQNGLLVLSEIWYPAWKATLDNNPTDVLRVNYSLRGVYVPSGKHTISLRYDSDAFRAGVKISAATLIFSVFGVVLLVFMRSSEKKKNQSPDTTPQTN